MGGSDDERGRDEERESSRRDRRRSRDRSRSRGERRRRRSRSRSGDRERRRKRASGFGAPPSSEDQQSAATRLQQMMVQQQQQANLMQHMMNMNNMTQGGKKARELYVGNLAIGMVTENMLRDFFNTAMKGLLPEEAAVEAVGNVWMAADMKYSFVEMRTAELATAAMALDKVELCGRSLNVGRPSGYVPPSGPSIPTNPMAGQFSAMQAMATGPMGALLMGGPAETPSKIIELENMLTEQDVMGDEYEEIVDDIKDECGKHGAIEQVKVPRSGANVSKAFIKYNAVEGATAAKNALSGRTFDGRKVGVKYVEEATFDAME